MNIKILRLGHSARHHEAAAGATVADRTSHGVRPLNLPATSGPFAAPDHPEPRLDRA